MNTIYEDLAQINEIISLKEQSLLIEGTAFFFNAFEMFSTLDSEYLKILSRGLKAHSMLDRSSADSQKVIVDVFEIEKPNSNSKGDVGQGDSSHSEDEKIVRDTMNEEGPPKWKKSRKSKKENNKDAG